MARTIKDEFGTGAGPFEFRAPALDPGEAWSLDFRNMEYEGQRRYFRKYLPFDFAAVTNLDSGNPLTVTYNNRYPDTVVPNAVESFDRQGVVHIAVENEGGSTISAGDVRVAVQKEPYGADDRAREQAQEGPLAQVVEKFTGISGVSL